MAKRRRDVVVVVATAAEAAVVVVVVASSGVVVTGVVASAFVAAGGMPVVDVGVAVVVVVVVAVAVGRRTGASVLFGVHRIRVVPADFDGVADPRPKRRRMQRLEILKNERERKKSKHKGA